MTAAVSVIVPTIGRPRLLAETLASIGRCEPAPAEVLVIDQSDDLATAAVVEHAALEGARRIADQRRGRGAACNEGLRRARHDVVLITDDDCVVRQDWVAVALQAMAERPGGIISGQVLPEGGDAAHVPSCLTLEEPRDYTGQSLYGVLFAGNMACSRTAILDIGGFDERVVPAAEDCDLCYRWSRAGKSLRHAPELVVWHRDWRSPEELARVYRGYYRGQGMFYAKHLRSGDRRPLLFLAQDIYSWLRSVAAAAMRRASPAADPRRAMVPGLPIGLCEGWRAFGGSARAPR